MRKLLEKFSANQIIALVSIILLLFLGFIFCGLLFGAFTTDFLVNLVLSGSLFGTIRTIYELTTQNTKKLHEIAIKLSNLGNNDKEQGK